MTYPTTLDPWLRLSVLRSAAAAAAKSLQSCPILCDPIDGSPPGSPVPGIPQARTLEWIAMPSPGDLPDPGIEPETPAAPALQADSLLLSHQGSPNTIYQRAKVTFVSQRDEKDQ